MAVPLARRPARENDHVTDLRPSPIEPVVEDDAAADPGSKGEQDEVRAPPPCAERPLGERRRIRVVLHTDREAETFARVRGEIEVVELQVGRPQHASRAAIEIRRHAEADGTDRVREHGLHGLVERVHDVLLARPGAQSLVALVHGALAVEDPGADLRPADVDSDHKGGAHGRGLP